MMIKNWFNFSVTFNIEYRYLTVNNPVYNFNNINDKILIRFKLDFYELFFVLIALKVLWSLV